MHQHSITPAARRSFYEPSFRVPVASRFKEGPRRRAHQGPPTHHIMVQWVMVWGDQYEYRTRLQEYVAKYATRHPERRVRGCYQGSVDPSVCGQSPLPLPSQMFLASPLFPIAQGTRTLPTPCCTRTLPFLRLWCVMATVFQRPLCKDTIPSDWNTDRCSPPIRVASRFTALSHGTRCVPAHIQSRAIAQWALLCH